MTHFTENLSSRMTAIILTVLFSTVAVLGAVGPAYTGLATGQSTTTTAMQSDAPGDILA